MLLILSAHKDGEDRVMHEDVEAILVRVANKYCAHPLDVARGRRHPRTVAARREWLREVKEKFHLSLRETGRACGLDFKTVAKACEEK